MEIFGKYSKLYGDWFYLVFRFLVGVMFFMHGSGKLFGWFGGKAMGFSGLMGFVGSVEFLVGLAIIFGFLVRLAALGGSLIMIGAYLTAHLGWNPLQTGGELALMYLSAFLVLIVFGARKWQLDKVLFKKEIF
ncbi:DoxX family protein [Candidatus Woesearchaeota archaeon]|nr:DoxX family protein [Candidatus Woesearchaeota archaeon]